ncbi:hypothetical protein, partial [Cecembia lonarensis]|uniref:hypothetical protein n=1 Tax=Cecembia lonarensis TaxID=645110 RepID=UPI000590FF99
GIEPRQKGWSLEGLGDWFCMVVRIVPEAQPIVSKKAVTIPLRPVGGLSLSVRQAGVKKISLWIPESR